MFTPWKFLLFFVCFPTVQVHMSNMIPRLHHLVSMKTSPERFFTDSGNSANLTFVGHWQIAHHLAKTQNAIHQTQQNDIIEIEQYDTFQLKYIYSKIQIHGDCVFWPQPISGLSWDTPTMGRTNFIIPEGFLSSAKAAFWLWYELSCCWIRI